jgi:hypothetical protein
MPPRSLPPRRGFILFIVFGERIGANAGVVEVIEEV